MSWQPHAQRLAERVSHRISRWRPIIATVPRHVFVPRWWNWTSPGSGYGTAVLATRLGDRRVTNVVEAWELWSTLGILHPGIEHHYDQHDSTRTAFMLHSDGSWARATAQGDGPPIVHQGGPRRLWDLLDDIRTSWLQDGSLPVYGAQTTVTPDGTIHLRRGRWQATVA